MGHNFSGTVVYSSCKYLIYFLRCTNLTWFPQGFCSLSPLKLWVFGLLCYKSPSPPHPFTGSLLPFIQCHLLWEALPLASGSCPSLCCHRIHCWCLLYTYFIALYLLISLFLSVARLRLYSGRGICFICMSWSPAQRLVDSIRYRFVDDSDRMISRGPLEIDLK